MKSIYLSLMVLCAITFAGCAKQEENALATDGATADDYAKYEEELAAVSGGESYEDAIDSDE
ncbi:hypothetical protein Enr13x_09980 [Stieleria neptunia]|uniref:Secreted protein n=1 Tax=Stieleria neptunia TaxID=2527979 RepID=A0A518HK52_9BACT|nr:hypothetical protein [Stieleria neptunia]QDV41160.1 hypothetical protein Enr13x_09980 [Stieleria neptunia]